MMKNLVAMVALVGLGASAGGCGTQRVATQVAATPPKANPLIRMQRGGCATEACQVYALSVFADGTVIYDGRGNVATVGQRQARLSPAEVNQLVTAFDAMNFLDTDDRCCVCPDVVASQPVIIDYRRPGSAPKTVFHDEGCNSAPPALSALERTIDQVTAVRRWTVSALAPMPEPTPEVPLAVSIVSAVAAAPDFGMEPASQGASADPAAASPEKGSPAKVEGNDAVAPPGAGSKDSLAGASTP